MDIREHFDLGCKVSLDRRNQVTSFDVALAEPIYGSNAKTVEFELFGTLENAQSSGFISGSTLLMKAKQFDDGLYAAVELLTQDGIGEFLGKQRLLEGLIPGLTQPSTAAEESVATSMLAAAVLGKIGVSVPDSLEGPVSTLVNEFTSNEWKSKPVSFYTWSPRLSEIFQQDRMLQEPLSTEGLRPLIEALMRDPALRDAYINIVDLVAKITNPFSRRSLAAFVLSENQGNPHEAVAFLPSSVSHETTLIKKLFGDLPVPPDFSLMEEVIRRLKQKLLSFRPEPNSGWYDYALWAIEPLVLMNELPESARLSLGSRYLECLLDLFRGAYCLARETHVKQLDVAACSSMALPTIYVPPECTIEPLPSVYLRRSYSYNYIKEVLIATFGEQALESISRQTTSGETKINLLQELNQIQAIFYGAHLVACKELGVTASQPQTPTIDKSECEKVFYQWTNNLTNDPDLSQDARCMVPVFFDRERNLMKTWVFLGWRKVKLDVSYKVPPTIVNLDTSGFVLDSYNAMIVSSDYKPHVEFTGITINAAYPAVAEVYVRKPMSRTEFAEHCDRYKTENAILDSLQNVTSQ